MMLEITKQFPFLALRSFFFIGWLQPTDAPKRRAVIRTDAVLGLIPGLGAQRSAVGSDSFGIWSTWDQRGPAPLVLLVALGLEC